MLMVHKDAQQLHYYRKCNRKREAIAMYQLYSVYWIPIAKTHEKFRVFKSSSNGRSVKGLNGILDLKRNVVFKCAQVN